LGEGFIEPALREDVIELGEGGFGLDAGLLDRRPFCGCEQRSEPVFHRRLVGSLTTALGVPGFCHDQL